MKQLYNNKKVVVTGGAGFIGSHVVEHLVSLGAHVVVVDDLSSGTLTNLEAVKDNITFMQGSITNAQLCNQALQNAHIVFHLAAYISVPSSFKEPTSCYEINIQGTQLLLEAARLNKVQRFVFSSSCAVYGPQEGILCETNPCFPQSPYGLSKFIGELLCKQYKQNFGLESVILRYFNVFGHRQHEASPTGGVVAQFRGAMRDNKSLIIYGTGMQKRDFVPVSTVVEANITAGIASMAKLKNSVFNVATGTSITLLELVDKLKREFPSYKPCFEYKAQRAGDIKDIYADLTLYQSLMALRGAYL